MRPEILFPLFAPIGTLKGVGPRVTPLLERLAGPRVRDVLYLKPQDLISRRRARIAELIDGAAHTLDVTIESHQPPARPGQPWKIRVFDETGFLSLIYFKGYGPHLTSAHPVGARRVVSGRTELDRLGIGFQIAHPDYLVSPERAQDIPTIEPVYPASAGLTSRIIRRVIGEALGKAPDLPEWQDVAWIKGQNWPSWQSAIRALHAPAEAADLSAHAPARRRLAYDELLAHQLALAERKQAQRRFSAPIIPASQAARTVQSALPFALTGAQERALTEIRTDLASGERMFRLLQGDVGAGKTVVALLAMIDVAAAGQQSALMAPTEILARQHFETLSGALETVGLKAVLLTGRHKGSARLERLQQLADGSAQIAVGTHALFQDDVLFKHLALSVIDEQHRFGVSERLRLQAKGEGVHSLAMSATPIPRTLELTVFGDLDVSRLDEKPPGRKPVATRAAPMPRLNEVVARLAVALESGSQAFWICPLVAESELVDLAAAQARWAALTQRFGERVGVIHGQLPTSEKDAVMARFVAGDLPILVSTTVVEVGVDVPAASIMIIEQAERFGLAQLHQLRGRVGRGHRASSCVLLYDPPLSEVAAKRLDILRRSDDGFEIAERDLELRGGGDPLGLAQSGFPAYRLADPIADRDLIIVAASDARLIQARDPQLLSPRGQALACLKALFDWRADSPIGDAG
jgi:ATP-dependent DNA helicase RecG